MTRESMRRLGFMLLHKASSEKYPTRSVEHMLAWMIVAWSAAVVVPGDIMVGDQYQYLLVIAPEQFWGICGLILGGSRIVALYLNGNWRRSPGLRFIGAMTGMTWWLILSSLYYVAIQNGAPDFPMRNVFFVCIFFEAYSCFRCGQDYAAPKVREKVNG